MQYYLIIQFHASSANFTTGAACCLEQQKMSLEIFIPTQLNSFALKTAAVAWFKLFYLNLVDGNTYFFPLSKWSTIWGLCMNSIRSSNTS